MSKVMGSFVKFRPFTKPTHQVWSCHVTQEANFENFLLCPNSTFNIRKSHKIYSGKALHFGSYQPKSSRGGGIIDRFNPPPQGLNLSIMADAEVRCS